MPDGDQTASDVGVKWWHRWFRTPGELRDLGVVGINMRNARFLLPNNPREMGYDDIVALYEEIL